MTTLEMPPGLDPSLELGLALKGYESVIHAAKTVVLLLEGWNSLADDEFRVECRLWLESILRFCANGEDLCDLRIQCDGMLEAIEGFKKAAHQHDQDQLTADIYDPPNLAVASFLVRAIQNAIVFLSVRELAAAWPDE